MNVTCMLITTNITNRLHLLENTVTSIENCRTDLFDAKVMSVDEVPDQTAIEYFKKFEPLGWKIVSGACAGRNGIVNNQRRGLSHVNTDWVLYTEDDILINRIPPRLCWQNMDQLRLANGKLAGFVCFNTHVHSDPNNAPFEKRKFINDASNYVTVSGERFLVKGPALKDDYYLNFPVSLVRKSLFDQLHNYASGHYNSEGVEIGLTHAWFGSGITEQYESLVYVRPDGAKRMPYTLNAFYSESNMNFWNNDTNLRHPSINGRQNSFF